jgi:hypothetical protein
VPGGAQRRNHESGGKCRRHRWLPRRRGSRSRLRRRRPRARWLRSP